jgi:MscS family membrane protein
MDFTTIPLDYITKGIFVVVVLALALLARRFIRFRQVPFLKPFRGVLIWGIAFLLILSNLGFNISSLLAAAGIGGIALALGMQSTLESFFSSLTLLTDKAFHVGDTIKIAGYDEGKVLKIGFRSTIVETANKRILIIPNKLLASGVIEKKKT